MRRILIAGLIALNVTLATAVLASAGPRAAPMSWFGDCCKGNGPEAYCCRDCCLFEAGCRGCEP